MTLNDQILSFAPAMTLGSESTKSGEAVLIAPQNLVTVARVLKDQLGFDMLIDIVAVDWHKRQSPRFEVDYLFYSIAKKARAQLKVRLADDENPSVDSILSLYPAADWSEREVYDMMGIHVNNHHNLRRILMWTGFEGHPLRKDYPITKRQPLPVLDSMLLEDQADSATSVDHDLGAKDMVLNLGPSHPAFHGALRTQVQLEGEVIVNAASELGYLHRCFEKHSENVTYHQIIPYTDRLNYVSALMNNVGYCKAIEDFMGVEIPERAIALRVLVCELSRIIDHLVCVGTNIVDIGALTNFWYAFNVRERVYTLIEKLTGARLTYSYTRIGGLSRDIYDGFLDDLKVVLAEVELATGEITKLISNNRIFMDRTRNVGIVSREDAIKWGFSGPCLRASGVDLDLRKAQPYYGYENYDFDIPIGEHGDTYDRIMIRLEEIHQSLRIMRQCMVKIPKGPIMTADRRIRLPEKQEVYSSIEGLMNHFKIVMHGIQPEPGQSYSATEAANGELGFYLIGDGTLKAYRLKCRGPCFWMFAAYEHIIRGQMVADAIAILGSLNIVAGECDR